MPAFRLRLPNQLNGGAMRVVVQDFMNGCPDGLPNEVSIDFARLNFIKPAGVTFLSNFISWLNHQGVRVSFQGHERDADPISFLDDSLFFEQHLGRKLNEWAAPRNTTRPLVHAHHEESQSEIRDRFIPWLARSLGKSRASLHEVQVCLLELFNNIQDHSSLDIGCLFAQHFPRENRVAIAVADFGIGIPAAVRQVYSDIGDGPAIITAARRGFTSGVRPRNMGEGLSILLDNIVGLNRGTVTIYSHTGGVRFNREQDRVASRVLPRNGFCVGTTIDIWIRTDTIEDLFDRHEVLEW
jgi:hypothetical protein